MKIKSIRGHVHQIFVRPPRPENNVVSTAARPGLGLTPEVDALKDSRILQE